MNFVVEVVNGVQLVDGKFDLVTFQLNTLDLSNENPVKNVVWVEKGKSFDFPSLKKNYVSKEILMTN